ncbi:hypothetical protein UFOVP1290_593 [uncultured Caudovirales phage]|uniref:Uncharacterized protein n=1 Tax=uncultured Caudovirales phage TaxID=2100421 RepID=A0A6J5RI89_9CAUD|nr:hypothetical protein UFOVP1290_593 [uncultured Caudovirales phage]
MTTFGEVNWNDDVFSGDKKNTNNKDLFLRLEEGSNELRLVTQPFQYLVHKVKKEPNNPKDFGQKVNCSAIHGSCPLCEAGDKAKPRWLIGVISRKAGAYRILDISFAVFSQIRKYARNTQRWGDPIKYDVDIVVDKAGGATGYYSVQAISKEPLSAADQVIKDGADLDDLKRRVTPPTADLVQKRIDKIHGVDTGTAATSAPSTTVEPKKVSVKTAVSMSDDEELDESFPNYAGDSKV